MILATRHFQVDNLHGLQILLCKFWKTPFEEVAEPCFAAFDAALRKFQHDPDITVIRPFPTAERGSLETRIHTAEQMALAVMPLKWKGMTQIWTLCLSHGKLYGNLPSWLRLLIEKSDGALEEVTLKGSTNLTVLPLHGDDLFAHLTWPGPVAVPHAPRSKGQNFYRFSGLLMNQNNEGRPLMSLELQV
jgi:hypothetical protein